MTSFQPPEGDPLFPWNSNLDATALALEGWILCAKFRDWQDDRGWKTFETEVGRLSERVGAAALRSMIYPEAGMRVLGIFIAKGSLPEEGIQGLF